MSSLTRTVANGMNSWFRQTFCKEDAELILALPIHVDMEDCVGAQGTSSGRTVQHWTGIFFLEASS
jgi:hypothetical protein